MEATMTALKLARLESAAHVYVLMRSRGCRLRLSEGVRSVAFEVLQPHIERGQLLSEVSTFVRSKAIRVPDGVRISMGKFQPWSRPLPGGR